MAGAPADKLTGSLTKLLLFAGTLSLGLVATHSLDARAAQLSDASPPSFEVASIKANHSGSGSSRIDCNRGGCRMTNVSVKNLILSAFKIQSYQVSGGPGWIASDRYDIDAKVDDALAEKTKNMQHAEREIMLQQMMLSLLADRFSLKFSHTTRDLPIYALIVAKNGPKLQTTKPDSAGGGNHSLHSDGHGGEMQIKAEDISMDVLARELARNVDRPILDRTGLTGNYDFTLQYSEDQSVATALRGSSAASPGAANILPADPTGPSIFTALQEQLGLKLEPAQGPVDVLVIDHIDPPTED